MSKHFILVGSRCYTANPRIAEENGFELVSQKFLDGLFERHNYSRGKLDHTLCEIRRSEELDFCVTHGLGLPQTLDQLRAMTRRQLGEEQCIKLALLCKTLGIDSSAYDFEKIAGAPVTCNYCTERFYSKGEVKKHTAKAHKDVLEARRKEFEVKSKRRLS